MSTKGRFSLNGIVDPLRIEELFNGLAATLDIQQTRIAHLEAELAARPTAQDSVKGQHALENLQGQISQRLGDIEGRLARVEAAAASIQTQAHRWDGVVEALPTLVTLSTFHAATSAFEATQQRQSDDFAATKRDTAIVRDIEKAQHRLVEELGAIQTMVACKVDRAEVPLLKAAADTLKDAHAFQATAVQRLDTADAELGALKRLVVQKEDKQAMVERMQKIAEQLSKKTGALHCGWTRPHFWFAVRTLVPDFSSGERFLPQMWPGHRPTSSRHYPRCLPR